MNQQKHKKFIINKEESSEKTINIINKVPMLKDYNIKFTKRENIDKKVLRKFRKFLKEKTKKEPHPMGELKPFIQTKRILGSFHW